MIPPVNDYLFFGSPVIQGSSYGTNLFVPTGVFRDTTTIGNAAKEFGRGYATCVGSSDPTSKITVAIGTNTYSTATPNPVTFNHGAAWATMVNDVYAYMVSNGYSSRVIVAGALHTEVDWNTPARVFDWINGYDSVNQRPLYANSDSSGCPQTGTGSTSGPCNNGWTQDDLYRVVWAGPSVPVPEQYATDGASARQWQQIARYAALAYGSDIDFKGALTQKQACDQKGNCVATVRNTSSQVWLLFRDELNKDSLSYQYVFWSSDMKWRFP